MEVYLHELSLILEANTTIGKESDAISNLQTLQRTLKTELIIPFSSQFSPKIIETIFSTILSLSFKESSSSNQNHITYSNTNSSNPINPYLTNYTQISFQDSLHHFLNHIVSLMKSFCPSTLLMILTNLSQTEQQKEENSVMVVWISQLIPILKLNDPLTIQLCEKLIQFCPKNYLRDIADDFWVLLREKLEKDDHLSILKNGIDLSDPGFAKQASILCQKYPNDTISYLIENASMHFISVFLSNLPETVIFDTISLNARISDAINLDGDFDEMIYSLQALPYLIERLSYFKKQKQQFEKDNKEDANIELKDSNNADIDIYCSDEITALRPVWKGILRQLKSLSSSTILQNYIGSRTFFIDTLLYGESHGFVSFEEILPYIDLDDDDVSPLLQSAYLNVIFSKHLDNEFIRSKVMSFLKMILSLSSIDRVDDENHCKPLNDMISFLNKEENYKELMKIDEKEFLSILRMIFNTNAVAFNKKSIISSQLRFILNHFDIINEKMTFINLVKFVRKVIELSTSTTSISDDDFERLLKLIRKIDYKVEFNQLDWFSYGTLIHRNIKLLQITTRVDSSFVFELLSAHLIDVNDISDALTIILNNAEIDKETEIETDSASTASTGSASSKESRKIQKNRQILSASVRIAMNYFSKCIEIIGFDTNEELRKYNLNIRTNPSNNSSDSSSSSNEVTWFEQGLLENLFFDIQCQFEYSRFGRFLAVITEFIYQGRKAAKLSQNAKILFVIYCRFLGSLIPVASSHLLTGLISDIKEELQKGGTSANSENLLPVVTSNKKQFFSLYFPSNHFDAIVDASASLFGIEETFVMYPELVNHAITYSFPIAKKFSTVLSQPLPKIRTFLAFLGVEKHKKWIEECIKAIPFDKWILSDCCCDGYREGACKVGRFGLNNVCFVDSIKESLIEAKKNDLANIKEVLEQSQNIDFEGILNNKIEDSDDSIIGNDAEEKGNFFNSLDINHQKLLISIYHIFGESGENANNSVDNEAKSDEKDEKELNYEKKFSFSFNQEEFIQSNKNEVPFQFNISEPSTIANLVSFFWHSYSLQAKQNKDDNDNSKEISIGIGCFANINEVEKFVLEHLNNVKLVLGFLTYVQRFDSYTIDVDKWVNSLKLQQINCRGDDEQYYIYSSALIIDAMTKKVNDRIIQKSEQIESSQDLRKDLDKGGLVSPSDLIPEPWMNFVKDSLEFIGVYNAKSLVALFFKKNGFAHLTIRAVFRLFGLISTFLEVAETATTEIIHAPKTEEEDNEDNEKVVKIQKITGPMLSCERIANQINRENIALGIAEVISTIPSTLSNVTFYINDTAETESDDTDAKVKKTQSVVEFERLVNLAKSIASDSKKHYDQLLNTCLEAFNGRTTDDMYCEILSTLSSTLFSKSRGKHQEGPKVNFRKSGVTKDEFTFDYDLNSMECYRLIPTNYQHNQCLLSFGEKLQNIQSGNTVLVPSTFIQSLLNKLDKECIVTRDFFFLIFNFALNTEQYLHICQLLEDKCPCTQDHLRYHFTQEDIYKNFFNCKPPSFERGVFRTFLSKFTICDQKQMKSIVTKMKTITGVKRIHPSLCYAGSKKYGMKPWKNNHFANLPSLLSIGYIDLKTVMRSFTEIGTSPIEIFATLSSIQNKELEDVHAWPSAQDAREDFALAIFNMAINTKRIKIKTEDKNEEENNDNNNNDSEPIVVVGGVHGKNGQSIFGNDCHYYDDFGIARSFNFHRDFAFAKRVSEVLLQRIPIDIAAKMLFDYNIITNPIECNNPINTAIAANRILQLAKITCRDNIVSDFNALLAKSDDKEKTENKDFSVFEFLQKMNDIESISKMIHRK